SERMIVEHGLWPAADVFQITSPTNSTLRFNFPNLNSVEGPVDYAVNFSDGKWHLMTGVLDVTAGKAYVYYDGTLAASKTTAQQIGTATAASTFIGARGNSTLFFPGSIDDVRIYNRALSADEVMTLYRSNQTKINAPQNSRNMTGLVGYWTFNGPDLTSTTASDV